METKIEEQTLPEKSGLLIMTADKISAMTGYKSEEIAVIQNTIAKGTTTTELSYFLSVCKTVGLNPFMKEIWCYKDGKGNVLVFAGRDGFLKKAQESKNWNGMSSFEVCTNDEFSMNPVAGIVTHNIKDFKNRGEIIGAYAILKPKGCELPTVEYADFKTFNKGYNVWKSDPASMIKKVAETHALKKAFGISGLVTEFDFKVENEIATPINTENEIEKNIQSQKTVVEISEQALQQISELSDQDEIASYYANRPEYHSNPKFMQLLNAQADAINGK